MAIHTDFSSLFQEIDKDMHDVLTNEIAQELVEIWSQMVYQDFYAKVPEGPNYARSFETLASISVLGAVKSGSGKTFVTIGYDSNKINTFENGSYTAHENPDEMGSLFEYGGIKNHNPNGIRAIDEMYKYVNSDGFKQKFNNKMRKRGYFMK